MKSFSHSRERERETRRDLGFSLPQSSISINHLLYADDTCVISNTPAGCQHLLDMVQRWLEWAQLKVKVPKCWSIVLQASSGVDVLPSAVMKFHPQRPDTFKFLGMPVRVYTSNPVARTSLQESLQQMLSVIDNTPLTRQQ